MDSDALTQAASRPSANERSGSGRGWITLLLAFALSLFLLRYLLLRGLQSLLRDRVRVRTLGSRGIRGLHFKTRGFGSPSGGAGDGGGVSLRIQQIYLTFNHAESHRSWFTLHIKGVGVQLGSKGKATHDQHKPDPPPPPPPAPGPAGKMTSFQAQLIRLARPSLYLLASALPFLTRLVDLEIDRVEIYSKEQQVVFRIVQIRSSLRISMQSSPHDPTDLPPTASSASSAHASRRYGSSASGPPAHCEHAERRSSLDERATPIPPRSFMGLWRDARSRVGLGAKGVAFFLATGLPEGRATVSAEWSGVQAFSVRSLPSDDGAEGQGLREQDWVVAGDSAEDEETDVSWNYTWDGWLHREQSAAVGTFDTSWSPAGRDGVDEADVHIEPKNRILFAPLTSHMDVNVLLGPNFFHLKAHRAFVGHMNLSEAIIGAQALQRVAQRSGANSPPPQRPPPSLPLRPADETPMAMVIAAIAGCSFHIDQVRCPIALRDRAGDTLHVELSVAQIALSMSSASPADALCQKWLNTISPIVKKERSTDTGRKTLRASLQDRLRRPLSPGPPPRSSTPTAAQQRDNRLRIEPRRVHKVHASVGDASVVVRGGKQQASAPDLAAAHVVALRIDALSTWTPAGLCPSVRKPTLLSLAQSQMSMTADPNEAAVYCDVQLESVEFNASTSLLSIWPSRSKSASPPSETRPRTKSGGMSLPKVHAGFHLGLLRLCVDADTLPSADRICLTVPEIDASLHAEYSEAHVVRTDAARRAAWKAWERGQLEGQTSAEAGNGKLKRTKLKRSSTATGATGTTQPAVLQEAAASGAKGELGQPHPSAPEASLRPTHRWSVDSHTHVQDVRLDLQAKETTSTLLAVGVIEGSCSGAVDAFENVASSAALPAVHFDRKRLLSGLTIDGVRLNLEGERIWSLLAIVAKSIPPSRPKPRKTSASKLDKIPQQMLSMVCVRDIDASLATVDRRRDADSLAGIKIHTDVLALDYAHRSRYTHSLPVGQGWGARSALELQDDAPLLASALAVKHGNAAVCKISLDELTVTSIDPKAAQETRKVRIPSNVRSAVQDIAARCVLLHVPSLRARISLRKEVAEDKTFDHIAILADLPDPLTVAIELANTYLLMLVGSCLRQCAPRKGEQGSEPTLPAEHRVKFSLEVTARRIDLPIRLPQGVQLFVGLRRVQIKHGVAASSVGFESLNGAIHRNDVMHDGDPCDEWSAIATVRDTKAAFTPSHSRDPPEIAVQSDSLILNIPFGFHLHDIVEGTSVSIKTTKQLIYELLLGSDTSAINPSEMHPKRVPSIQLRLRMFVFEAEDDPMETKLGLIWRSGRDEARARLERDAAFAEKMAATMQKFKSSSRWSVNASREEICDSGGADGAERAAAVELMADAHHRLEAFNSSSWLRRLVKARSSQERREETINKRVLGKFSRLQRKETWPIEFKPRSSVAPLFRSVMSDVHVHITEPHGYNWQDPQTYINSLGDRIPEGMRFSIMIPLHLRWKMTEWRVNIRDYPLPLLHVAPCDRDRDALPLDMTADLCIAEQMGGQESTRIVDACIVHEFCKENCDGRYVIHVPKVTMPTKIFGTPTIHVGTSRPMRLCWGQSIQPAITDVAKVFDGFSSPPLDPSPKTGFWDKLPLILHGHASIEFVKEGALHLYLKGSRDPYDIYGLGAGWVKCLRNNVRVTAARENPEGELLQIKADEYVLAIPDLNASSRQGLSDGIVGHDDLGADAGIYSSALRTQAYQNGTLSSHEFVPQFSKVVAHFRGDVCWGIGLVRERTCDPFDCQQTTKCSGTPFYRQCRYFDRISHWDVVPKTPQSFHSLPADKQRDTFAGWRHDHLHLSIAVRAKSKQTFASTIHLTPLVSEHFWAWIRLFNSVLSLPIRQGKMFPENEPKSPKFGFHLATIKYRLDLTPLSLSHVYLQHLPEKYRHAAALYVGLKGRTDRFNVDVHQRQQETFVKQPLLGGKKKTLHKPINEAEVDLEHFQLRAVCAEIRDSSLQMSQQGEWEGEHTSLDNFLRGDSHANRDNAAWIDLNDYVELGVPHGRDKDRSSARVRTEKMIECPSFNFYRNIRCRGDKKDEEEEASSGYGHTKFGDEDTHTCAVGHMQSPNEVQSALSRKRAADLRAMRPDDPDAARNCRERATMLDEYGASLSNMNFRESYGARETPAAKESGEEGRKKWFSDAQWREQIQEMQSEWDAFKNRYICHNPVIFLSDGTRDVVLKYYLSNRSRRGLAHSLTAKAVRIVRRLDLGRESSPTDSDGPSPDDSDAASDTTASSSTGGEEDRGINLLRSLLRDTMQYVNTERELTKGNPDSLLFTLPVMTDPRAGIRDDFQVLKTNICILLKPQIVLRSELDDSSCVILTALRTRLTNHLVRDDAVFEDDVNEKVMNRTYFTFEKFEAWHPRNPASKSDQPFALPLEVLLDSEQIDERFSRLMPRTDCVVHYDKFNKLRMHDASRQCVSEDSSAMQDHLRHHMDLVRVHCPRFSIHANAAQFAAIYNIITDLLLYRDPTYKEHAKRLETTLFAYNFRDAEGLARMVESMQMRIRHAEGLHQQYQQNFIELNDEGKLAASALFSELKELQDDLILFMEAITVAQDRRAGSDKDKKSALRLEASAEDVAWFMESTEQGLPLAELEIHGPSFTWLNKADNSTANTLSVMGLHARNNRPDALFQDIISKYTKVQDNFMVKQGRFLNAAWSVLAPVGGISIVDRFELNVHPLRVQIEISVGREIMNYIFGTRREREKQAQSNDMKRSRPSLESRPSNGDGGASPRLKPHDSHAPLHRQALMKKGSSSPRVAANSNESLQDALSKDVLSLDEDVPRGRTSKSHTLLSSRAVSPSAADRKKAEKNEEPLDMGSLARDENQAIAFRHAVEMRKRAAANKTFVYVKVPQTVFCLSYKGDKGKSITDLYDLVFKAPTFEYRNRTWAYEDLANSFKRDVLRAAWGQKTTLLKGFLTHRPQRISAKLALRDKIRKQQVKAPANLAKTPALSDMADIGAAGVVKEEDEAASVSDAETESIPVDFPPEDLSHHRASAEQPLPRSGTDAFHGYGALSGEDGGAAPAALKPKARSRITSLLKRDKVKEKETKDTITNDG